MKTWEGAAAICLNESREILLVLQGTPEEEKKWSIPSGGREGRESFEDCCIREVLEETGYQVEIINKIFIKEEVVDDYNVIVPYFHVKIIGGSLGGNDPDNFIHDVRWVSLDSIDELIFSFPGDKQLIRSAVKELSIAG